jgi:hypothetical protein
VRAQKAASDPSASAPKLMQQEVVIRNAAIRIFLDPTSSSPTSELPAELTQPETETGKPADHMHDQVLKILRRYYANAGARVQHREKLLHYIAIDTWNQPDSTPLWLHDKLSIGNDELPGRGQTAIT